MSTTFGIRIPSTDEVKPIARRVGIGQGKVEVWFTELLAEGIGGKCIVVHNNCITTTELLLYAKNTCIG